MLRKHRVVGGCLECDLARLAVPEISFVGRSPLRGEHLVMIQIPGPFRSGVEIDGLVARSAWSVVVPDFMAPMMRNDGKVMHASHERDVDDRTRTHDRAASTEIHSICTVSSSA